MLQFLKIEINNFGPYKGENEVSFSANNGVTIFWGENGRGKTSLLNAFRYGLFGVVENRRGKLTDLRSMENEEGRNEGIFGFSVAIEMKKDEDVYKLIRSFTPKDNNIVPSDDSDYQTDWYLTKNNMKFSRDESKHILNTLMPIEVSRFFLFDGELLKQYEDLVREEEYSADLIKESIEKILGVPILKNAIRDLDAVKTSIENNMNRIARNSRRTAELSARLIGVSEELQNHEDILRNYQNEYVQLREERIDIENRLRAIERIREIIVQRTNKEEKIKELQDKKGQTLNEIMQTTSTCWRGILSGRLSEVVKELNHVINGLEQKRVKGITARSFIAEIKKACEESKCPICTQEIGAELISVLEEKIRDSESEYSGLSKDDEDLLLSFKSRASLLQSLSHPNKKEELAHLEKIITQISVDIDCTTGELKLLNKAIEKYECDNGEIPNIDQLISQYNGVEKKINNLQNAISNEKKLIDDLKSQKQTLYTQLERNGNDDVELSNEINKSTKIKMIYEVFKCGLEKYCERLKENVQRDATDIFVKIANDSQYSRLAINDKYGLEIYTENNIKVPNRSAGYEHVVAMSLMAALHKNAPQQGPIIMDSPFGRLDKTHSQNIISVLPLMANQVILLVYDGEIDPVQAREKLGASLLAEKHLNYVSALHTEIL